MLHKIILLILAIFTMSGFKLLTNAKWLISEADPTIWVKLCSEMRNHTISKNDLDGDVLAGETLSGETVLSSIVSDFNNVNSSYLRLAVYPDDPSNPGSPEAGDSPFTLERALHRTIDICFNDPTNPFEGGGAELNEKGSDILGCSIVISEDAGDKAKNFVQTLTHEIGHCAGLDHPQETRNAVMSYFSSDDKIRLMIDDKMGLVYLYPRAGVDVKEKATLGLMCSRRE